MENNNPDWKVVLIRDGEIYGYMDEPNVYARHMKDVPHLVFTAEGGVNALGFMLEDLENALLK